MTRRGEGAATPAVVKALGQLVANFSMLEVNIAFGTWELLDTDQPAGQIMTAGLGFQELLSKFCSLYRLRVTDEQKLRALDELRVKLQNVNESRNGFIHAFWGKGSTSEAIGFPREVMISLAAPEGLPSSDSTTRCPLP